MARARKKTPDVYEDERRGLRPGSALLLLVALGFGSAIVWNAFNGSHQPRSLENLLAEIPEGATTSIVVPAPQHAVPKTITIKYDPAVEDIQRELMATGQYRGLVDGVMGAQTMLAIKQFQEENGLVVDGRASPELLEKIRFTRKVQQAANQTGSVDPAAAVPAVAKPVKVVAKPVKTAAKQPAQDDRRLRILDVQMRLARLGYDPGESNGLVGEGTKSAILQFELENGLSMDGEINAAFMTALKAVESGQSVAAQ